MDDEDDEPVPLPNVNSVIMKKVYIIFQKFVINFVNVDVILLLGGQHWCYAQETDLS